MPKRLGVVWFAALVWLFLVANRGAYQGYFEDDDLDNLASAAALTPGELAAESVLPRLRELDVRALGFVYYSTLWRAAGFRFGPYVGALHALHLLSVLVLWLLLRKLGMEPPAAAAGALFYAFHAAVFDAYWRPMFVFDVVCGLFCLLSLLCYVRGRVAASFVFFYLAYRAKEPALMLPAVLVWYEWLLGQKRWKRLAPFVAVALFFGLKGVVLGRAVAGGDYRLSIRPADLWRTVSFYSSEVLLVPYGGLALAAAYFWVKDRRFRFGLCAAALLLVPMLALPGRLFGVYLYVPLIGVALAVAALAARFRLAWIALFFALWLPWNYALARVKRRALLGPADERRAYVSSLAGVARDFPSMRAFVYDSAPAHLERHGIRGALRLLLRDAVQVQWINDAGMARAVGGQPVVLLNWEPGMRKLAALARQAGERPVSYLRMEPLTPVWQLTEGWYGRDGNRRWTEPRARAQLWRPPGASRFEMRMQVGPLQAQRLGRVEIRVRVAGDLIGRREFDRSGWYTLAWNLEPLPEGVVDVEFETLPPFRAAPDDPNLLGAVISEFGFAP